MDRRWRGERTEALLKLAFEAGKRRARKKTELDFEEWFNTIATDHDYD